jgi:hypothetical protein
MACTLILTDQDLQQALAYALGPGGAAQLINNLQREGLYKDLLREATNSRPEAIRALAAVYAQLAYQAQVKELTLQTVLNNASHWIDHARDVRDHLHAPVWVSSNMRIGQVFDDSRLVDDAIVAGFGRDVHVDKEVRVTRVDGSRGRIDRLIVTPDGKAIALEVYTGERDPSHKIEQAGSYENSTPENASIRDALNSIARSITWSTSAGFQKDETTKGAETWESD